MEELEIIFPTKMDVVADESVYRAKLCGTLSLFTKLIVTLAPAGTVMVLLSKEIFCAVRSMVTACAEEAAVDEAPVLVLEEVLAALEEPVVEGMAILVVVVVEVVVAAVVVTMAVVEDVVLVLDDEQPAADPKTATKMITDTM